jgi:serine protease Do
MTNRTFTIASFLSVAMAAVLFGAFVTTQINRPESARAADPQATSRAEGPGVAGPFGLNTFREIARRDTPGVVNINTSKVVKRPQGSLRDFFGDDLLERFAPQGPRGVPRNQTQTSLGSGFVIDKDGYVLTNRHVIDGADDISVTLANGKSYAAKLVGKDSRTDVALLKIEAKEPLTSLELGDSDQTDVGEWVMAVGNPFGLWRDGVPGGPSVTVGVVSYKGRDLELGVRGARVEMIQTDAAINPGNSGGPLINTQGQVIGINTLIVTGGERQSSGVGFSVPINVAKDILPQLREKGKVVRGWLGIAIEPMREDVAKTFKLKEASGALVTQVTPGSPADKAGLVPEDVVVKADARKIGDNGDLSRYISSRPPGSTVKLDVIRGGADKSFSVVLGTFPEEASEDDTGEARHGKLGMTLQDLTPSMAERLELPRGTKGPLVTDVEAGEPAEKAGLLARDVIVSVNGTPVSTVEQFESQVEAAKKDGAVRLRVLTNGAFRIVVLKLP